MRKKIIAGNWKMNHNLEEACNFIKNLKSKLSLIQNPLPRILLAPPYPFLDRSSSLAGDTPIEIISQNIHHKEEGTFTGEVSAKIINSLGIHCTIVGHSERRAQFFETDEIILNKILQALTYQMEVILCVGENFEQRSQGKHFEIIQNQLEKTLFKLDTSQINSILIAYEPMWAIGSGESASPAQAQVMHDFIRKIIKEKFDFNPFILYGGSLNAKNAKEILSQKDIDGGLIGGASLEVEGFFEILKIASKI